MPRYIAALVFAVIGAIFLFMLKGMHDQSVAPRPGVSANPER